MINMMYLVLTALLALNVSKEILDSFVTVNNGLENTKLSLNDKMSAQYASFEAFASENSAKYGAAWNEAKKIKTAGSELVAYVDSIKVKAIMKAEGLPFDSVVLGDGRIMDLMKVNKKDSHDELTNMMVGSEPGKPIEGPFTARELRAKLEAFRDLVKGSRPDDDVLAAAMDRLFEFEDRRDASGTMNNWSSINFYHVPLAAGITILSKIQSDVRNAEGEVVKRMMDAVEGKSFKFNKLTTIVKPLSSYVTVGGTYQAEIFLGAYDDQNAPEVYIAGPGATVDTIGKKIIGEAIKLDMVGAKAQLKQQASAAGLRSVKGIIKFKPVGGEETTEVFETTYEVAAPSLVVSPTKMNVFYRGVDNPVSVSVSGYSNKDISATATNGVLSKTSDGYIMKPGRESEATIGATVTNPDGTKKSMTGMKFRVKNVPSPTAFFGGKSVNDETIKKAELTAAAGVIAKMIDFEFDLRFEVVEYRVTMIVGGTPIEKMTKGPAVSGDMKEMFQKAKPGQKVYIEQIKARGPDGTTRNLGSLSFKVV
ncbi:MAG: gliding motility protein GldM [Flavobacteriales bacterium]|nr:gliding motility protein GldM [Flavobacteriales bacterium]MBK6549868.1 gliding motility protein GldM [Flavobacteriales bacterium]MBK6881967.1 gliding motility protein GldM [Flavobacteriales bacterium]MBK7102379.1 gliding motility protein GldM [Flavobacteriales bacterium]MBK7113119.1 gliding motility protein GldM [Flavobacteriales bacterium]